MKQYKNRSWLWNQYRTLEKSSIQIAKEIGVTKRTILNWLHKFKIPIRVKSETTTHLQEGEKMKSGGYIIVKRTNHPKAGGNGCVLEHKLVMEEMLGRYLKHGEIIHHINGVKTDNRPENLCLCENSVEHGLIHKESRKLFFWLVIKGIIKFDKNEKEYYYKEKGGA